MNVPLHLLLKVGYTALLLCLCNSHACTSLVLRHFVERKNSLFSQKGVGMMLMLVCTMYAYALTYDSGTLFI